MDDLPRSLEWETEIVDLLTELSAVQDELLAVLSAKRQAMAGGAIEELVELQPREAQLAERLEACHRRRRELLEWASRKGLPSDSLRRLAASAPEPGQARLGEQVQQAAGRMRLLQHHSLANWVLAQRSLLHLSQLLEILATGGRPKPTYSKEEAAESRGALVDRAA